MRPVVLVAGSANLDFVVQADHVPAPGETVLGQDLQTFPGGKGANLAEMASIGLPVPPGFTIATEECLTYLAGGSDFTAKLRSDVAAALNHVEKTVGKGFGDAADPPPVGGVGAHLRDEVLHRLARDRDVGVPLGFVLVKGRFHVLLAGRRLLGAPGHLLHAVANHLRRAAPRVSGASAAASRLRGFAFAKRKRSRLPCGARPTGSRWPFRIR